MPPDPRHLNISVAQLSAFCQAALSQTGLSQEDIRTTIDVLVTTDTWGVFTHGTKSLRGYLRRLHGGGLRPGGRPRIVSEGPAWAMVDADSAIGMVGSTFAMRVAMAKARVAGLGYVGVRNSCHFGAAGYYTSMAAAENMIGIAMANDIPSVSAPGSRVAVLGSNPIAFAVPTGDARPIMLDMATSAVAGGKVYAAAALGKPIPTGWIIDAEGLPTTDPNLLPNAASLVPMAGHKGYGIAILIETLAGILTGASIAGHVLSWSFGDPGSPTDHGAAFLAWDVEAMMPFRQAQGGPGQTFSARVRQTMDEIRSAPKAKGVDRIYLPGEMEWEHRERALRDGIPLPEDVWATLRELAKERGIPGLPSSPA